MSKPSGNAVAIVTGAARNIGREIALALARGGAAVLVNAKSNRAEADATADMIQDAGGRALVHLADVTDEAAVAAMVDAAAEQLGPPTILVNNAALRNRRALPEMTLTDWREVLSINLDGAFICARACLPHMLAAGRGRIVSIGGKTGHAGAAERAHVVASKAGLVGFTKALAVEFGAKGITANCVVPGDIETERGASAGPHALHSGGNLVGHRGAPSDIAAMVAHLCSPAGAYITGQAIHVNGGGYLP